jgi:hypothetical protein
MVAWKGSFSGPGRARDWLELGVYSAIRICCLPASVVRFSLQQVTFAVVVLLSGEGTMMMMMMMLMMYTTYNGDYARRFKKTCETWLGIGFELFGV